MNQHPLDNPIWNALTHGNSHFAQGNAHVKYFPENVGPFVGFENFTDENFNQLYNLIPKERTVALVTVNDINIPDNWKILHRIDLYQMVCAVEKLQALEPIDLKPLNYTHVPQMLELTKLTNPGPFLERTIDFGNFYGIFDNKKLIAMAGQRFSIGEFHEVSGVCTHPDYLGNAYGKKLTAFMAHQIKDNSRIPFLHVRAANSKAVKIYQDLGFFIRSGMVYNIIRKREEIEL